MDYSRPDAMSEYLWSLQLNFQAAPTTPSGARADHVVRGANRHFETLPAGTD
jgi:hypothetical protein